MSEFIHYALAWFTGLLLGGVFFGGLWWTVNVILLEKRPTAWLLGSWLLRMGITLSGFYLVGREQWQLLLLCLLGFLMARAMVKWLTRLPNAQRSLQGAESEHAP
ncbi:MAG: ATP synthase subunit I [Halioglobus sp.]